MPALQQMVATSSNRSSPLGPVLRKVRLAWVLVTVGIYTVLAPFGYAGLWLLCVLWRSDPPRRARAVMTDPRRLCVGGF